MILFSLDLRWLPLTGRGGLAHLVLPAVTLGTALAAILAALLVTPAAAAAQLTKRFVPMMLLSATFGIFASVAGLYASFQLHAASGATIVLLATVIFFVALGISATRRRQRAA